MVAITTRWRLVRCQSGAQLIEMALVTPILLMILAGIIDFGFLFRNWEVVTNAAREGARAAILDGYAADDVRSRIQQYMNSSGIAVTCAIGGSGPCRVNVANNSVLTAAGTMTVRDVTVTYTHSFLYLDVIGPLVGGTFGTVPLGAVASMRTETQAAAP